jgi:hypothetical protein
VAALDDVERGSTAVRLDVSAAAVAAPPRSRRRARLALAALGVFTLLGAMAGGLARLGWPVPVTPGLAAFHGPLMVAGFLGTRSCGSAGRRFIVSSSGGRPALYLPLGLLHASLALRLAGDCAPWLGARRGGGLLNAIAILAFIAVMAHGIVARERQYPLDNL